MKDTRRGGVVAAVFPGGIGEEIGLAAGDVLLSINGRRLRDIFDYQEAVQVEYCVVEVLTRDGSVETVEIEKDPDEDLGVDFESPVFDGIRVCRNRCVFCFVDQMPPGLRPSLYVKDEDYRYSFLFGNYITMSDLGEEDVERIGRLRLSPLYVSVHATDPRTRESLLGRPERIPIMERLERLRELGIGFYTQIVLCPGWNDGKVLAATLEDLCSLLPDMLGTAVVPVGLTRHRSGLPPLRPVGRTEARQALEIIDGARRSFRSGGEPAPIYAADELFIKAGTSIPESSYYGDKPDMLEDGVGMLRAFFDEIEELRGVPLTPPPRPEPAPAAQPGDAPKWAIATGGAAAPFFERWLRPWLETRLGAPGFILEVPNVLMGEEVDVAGLMCGADLRSALDSIPPAARPEVVLVPEYALKRGTTLMLDDMPLERLEEVFNLQVLPGPDSPLALEKVLRRLLGLQPPDHQL